MIIQVWFDCWMGGVRGPFITFLTRISHWWWREIGCQHVRTYDVCLRWPAKGKHSVNFWVSDMCLLAAMIGGPFFLVIMQLWVGVCRWSFLGKRWMYPWPVVHFCLRIIELRLPLDGVRSTTNLIFDPS